MRRRQHHGFHARVRDGVRELCRELEVMRLRKIADVVRLLAHAADEAQALALALGRLNDSLAPASKADDCSVDHVCPEEGRWKRRDHAMINRNRNGSGTDGYS